MDHSELRQSIVAEARSWLGTPFQHQGRMKGVGVDCIGLVYEVAKKFDLAETDMRVIKAKGFAGYPKVPLRGQLRSLFDEFLMPIRYDDALAGDIFLLRFERHEGHAAIYTGENTIIHVLSTINRCTEHSINADVRRNITSAYRFPKLWT